MSDEFDKEAEREKLRERFEREEEDRQATEHMSQLLLQGATMTNRHCDDCGDPIFRHDGQEFCPTCEKPVTPDDQQADADQQTAHEQTQEGAGEDPSARSGEPADGGDDQSTPHQSHGSNAGGVSPSQPTSPRQSAQRQQSQSQSHSPPKQPPDQAGGQQSASQPMASSGSQTADLGDARLALVRRITTLAREAEATEDIQRTRQLFEAVHEGADALAALNRNADR